MTLAQRLEALRKAGEKRIPAEARAIMHRATEDLRNSGIVDRVVKAGQQAPSFELVNQHGNRVGLPALLARGPVVISFYRGVW